MAACPQHTFQVLTKRPKRALEFFAWLLSHPEGIGPVLQVSAGPFWPEEGKDDLLEQVGEIYAEDDTWPLPNVHLGVSVEDEPSAVKRIPVILQCPASVHWVSMEPILGDIDLSQIPYIAPPGIDWVVVGGESGHGARPCNIEWIRSIVDQCQAAEVPVFVKQLGAKPTRKGAAFPVEDKKGAYPPEWPTELRVREFPALKTASEVTR